ncbi:MAG: 50S ribosome-binding GTPase [Bifidobacteriaceae bacterium]|jgi:predicted ATPase|nr:50S ribosome-binding GTPase [Bifidobacteriaceae bacterium]
MMAQGAEALRAAIGRLREAAELSAGRLGPDPASEALAAARRVEERLERGVDHTIVALEGGTGSGKSALFNALAELPFAEVSAIRPTTRKANACVWGPGAEPLLDWLGIERDSWIKRDSVLDEHIGELRGLILVDLPDFDSALETHRLAADNLEPLADVVVWVTDPQKYADPALHQRFVAAAKSHPGRVNLAVLNQVDVLSPQDAGQVARDLVELLVGDGWSDPEVVVVSAETGAGVGGLRTELTSHISGRTAALRRAASEVEAAGRRLAADSAALGDTDQSWMATAAAAATETLVAAAIPGDTVAPPVVPGQSAARSAASIWVAQAALHLPEQWGEALELVVGSPANISARLAEALGPLRPPPAPSWWDRVFRGAKKARQRRAEWVKSTRQAVEPVVDRTMVRPTAALVADRARLAELTGQVVATAQEVQSPLPGGRPAGQRLTPSAPDPVASQGH